MAEITPQVVTDTEFASLMDRLGPSPSNGRLAVAVSGGPDSMALAILADRWTSARSVRLFAYTVDHQLREESADEAAFVEKTLVGRGLSHRTLLWRRQDGAHTGQAAARQARYDLLMEACRQDDASDLLLAHHRDDQVETLLLRLERQTGSIGLPAMRSTTWRAGVRLLRPFLPIPKLRLESTCRAAGIVPRYDPTNQDETYDRPAIRRHLAQTAEATKDALASATRRAARIATKLNRRAVDGLESAVRFQPQGFCWLDPDLLAERSPIVADQMLSRIIQAIGGARFLRGEAVDQLSERLRVGGADFQGQTVGRVYVRRGRDNENRQRILVCREGANLPAADVTDSGPLRWDDRFSIDFQGNFQGKKHAGAVVSAIGSTAAQSLRKVWNCPADVAATLPALWQDGEIVALPQFSFHDRLELAGSLNSFECVWLPQRPVTKCVIDKAGAGFVDEAPVV